MDKISLAGTIGTWVAVFIGILALVGVVGPVLVWRASRTESQVALKAVDSGLAENWGFMMKACSYGLAFVCSVAYGHPCWKPSRR